MKKTNLLIATLGVGLLAVGTASADTVSFAGNTATAPDGTFANPNGFCNPCAYSLQEFTVNTDGVYTIDAFYPGDPALDLNMDGYLLLYAGSFDPLAPAGSIASDDDGPSGSTTSQILDVALTAGTSYFLVTTAFNDTPGSFGQPAGAFENTISGVGDITLVGAPIPVPAAFWLFGSALIGLGAARRRKS